MLARNSFVTVVRIKNAFLALPLLLAACGTSGPTNTASSGEVRRVGGDIERALCEGRGEDALRKLTAEPLMSPTDRFYKALAYERSGRVVSARREYAAVMQSGTRDQVYLRCGENIVAYGTASAEAGRRLALVAQDLRAMDVAAREREQLHQGLPSLNGTRVTSTAGYASGGAMAVSRPGSTSPLGRWFAHLASYGSYENAQTNKPTLENKFPSLTGYIDQWEVNVGSGAVRLGVRLDSRQDAQRLCQQVKSSGDYCAVLDTAP